MRTLEAGKTYTLREHPTLDGLAFVPLALTHVATNNLASELTHLQHAGLPADFGHGSYRQRSAMSSALFAAEHLHLTAQRDAQLSAGATLAAASAGRAGLHAAQGGLKAIANHGPVSLEAHTDTLQVLADASVTLTSTQARIDILAQRRIVLQAGASTLTLEGKNITFACPGQFVVKSQVHAWMGPERLPATLDPLPDTQADLQRKYRLSR